MSAGVATNGQRLPPVAWLLLPALALALNWPYLGAGFAGDDVILLNLLRQGSAPPWWRGLWSVTDLPCFTSLWWVDGFTAGGFWRPLPSLVLQGSLALFGEHALPLHLLGILLHGTTAALIGILAVRLLGNARLGWIAGVVFVACEDHSMVVGWITTLTDVLGAAFATLSLLWHVEWLERRRPSRLALALVALVAALGCKESAIVVPIGLAGLTAVHHARRTRSDGGSRGWRRASLRDRRSWAPGVAVGVAYLLAYRALGFGVGGSLLYADPFTEPLAFLRHLVTLPPQLWLATLSPVPPSLGMFVPAAQPVLMLAGIVAFAGFLVAVRPLRNDPVAWWALLFYLAAIAPQTGAEGGERALYLPFVPASVLLAIVAGQAGPLARWAGRAPAGARSLRAAAWWLLGGVLVPGVVLSALYAFMYKASFDLPGRQVASLVALVEERRPQHVLVLNTSGPFLTFYLADELAWRAGRRVDTRVLSSLNGVLTLERTDERSFILRTDRRGWLTNLFALVPRTSTRLGPHQVFERELLKATIVEIATDRGSPDALAVRFDLALAPGDPRLLVVTWTGTAFVQLALQDEPLATPRVLADTSDVWAGWM